MQREATEPVNWVIFLIWRQVSNQMMQYFSTSPLSGGIQILMNIQSIRLLTYHEYSKAYNVKVITQ